VIRFLIWLTKLFPAGFRREFDAELRQHLERDRERARSRGRWAEWRFGAAAAADLIGTALAEHWDPGIAAPHTAFNEGHGMRWKMSEWSSDLRLAWRALRRSPGFAAVSMGTLGLAIGATAGMFSVVDAVLIRPLPYAHPDRLIAINATAPGSELSGEFGPSPEFFVQYHDGAHLLEDVGMLDGFTSTLRVDERVERIQMAAVTPSVFSTLGARALVGRIPIADDQSRVAVISYTLWKSWFAGDPAVIGKSYFMGNSNRTIVGVMPPDFRLPSDGTLLWLSATIPPAGFPLGQFGHSVIARVKPGATAASVVAELNGLARQIPSRFGGSPDYTKLISQHRAVVRPLREQVLGPVVAPLWILFGAVTIVLLIACANVANLFMVRTEGRLRDMAVRRAIGAGRWQLIRMQMAESLVVALCAGIVAVMIAVVALPLFLRAAPPIPRLSDVTVGPVVVLFTAIAALLSALACGVIPALRASEPDLARLREGGRGSTRHRHWMRDSLVVGQTALALVLLISSGLLLRSFAKLAHVRPGYDTRDLFTFQIAPRRKALHDGPTFARFDLDFMNRLRTLPGVQSVGLVDNVPLDEDTQSDNFHTDAVSTGDNRGRLLNLTYSAGDYFRTMGIRVLRGRPFIEDDQLTAHGNIVISKAAATKLWPGRDPIGRRLQRSGTDNWETVVGEVDDVLQNDFRDPPEPVIYYPLVGSTDSSWAVTSPAYVIKTSRAETIAPEVRAVVHEMAPEAPMYRVFTMAELASRSLARLTFTTLTLGIAATLALILGSVGLYGVLSYVVAQRTREIGVRMALGAEASQVRRMVVAQGARVVGLGVVIGMVAALAATRALGSLLYGVGTLDPVTFGGMSLVLLLVGVLASYVPARRASNVDPMESLRES
jgi:putative ABC transport system permease protein